MQINSVLLSRWAVCAAGVLALMLAVQVAVAVAAGLPETYAMPQIIAQVATPTPFRFLTPTPSTGTGGFTSTPSTSTTTSPRAGGIPMELAIPALAGGLAAIGGGSFLFRRKTTR
jgi:hypothetical protein